MWMLLVAAAASPGWDAFTRAFDEQMDKSRRVGGAAVLVLNGAIAAHHEHGYADRARNVKVDAETLFHYGSITKLLTGISVFQLRDRGRLSLDDKIVGYLPELRQVHGQVDAATLRMLLTHTAGFQSPTWPYKEGKPWEPFEPTAWSQLVAMMPYQQLDFAPGTSFQYSNPAFIYLARVVEQLTGDPWELYVQKNVFAPLGLWKSYFGATPYHLAAHRGHRYEVLHTDAGVGEADNGADFDPGITIPNGGWNAPLGDLAAFAAFVTGARPDRGVLERATLEEMMRPAFPTGEAGESVGMPFFVWKRARSTVIGHTGSQGGYFSFLFFNPATKAAVIAAINTGDSTEQGYKVWVEMKEAGMKLVE